MGRQWSSGTSPAGLGPELGQPRVPAIERKPTVSRPAPSRYAANKRAPEHVKPSAKCSRPPTLCSLAIHEASSPARGRSTGYARPPGMAIGGRPTHRSAAPGARAEEIMAGFIRRFRGRDAPPGSRPESHRPASTDPRMKVSLHGARAVQLPGRVAQLPVREQAGRPFADSLQPCSCAPLAVFQSLVLPSCPAHQMAVDAPA